MPTFVLDNRGKRSLVLDLGQDSDRDQLDDLLAVSDVFITNTRLDALERFGLGLDGTTQRHPHLVYASITGFGLRGDDRYRPRYDIGAFWARSGLSHQLSADDAPPLNVVGAIGDHVTSLAATVAILAGLFEREATGRGGVVETSLLETGSWVLGWDLALQATMGRVHRASPRTDVRTPLLNSYRIADHRWIFLMGLEVDRHFPGVCRAVGRTDLLDDPRFADAKLIRNNRRDLISILDEVFAQRTLDEWAPLLDSAGVWWSPCNTPAEVLADPQLAANEVFPDISVAGVPRGMVASPFKVFGRASTAGEAPKLGAHTDELLGMLPDQSRPS